MDRLNALSESFKTKYERFLIGCDSIEELDQWDKEANGKWTSIILTTLLA